MAEQHIIFFDLETGGLKWWPHMHNGEMIPGNPVIEIKAQAARISDLEPVDNFHARLRFDESHATEKALELNSYDSKEWILDAVLPEQAVPALKTWLNRWADHERVGARSGKRYFTSLGCGHNAAGFDMPFLRTLFDKHNHYMPMDSRCLDTMILAQFAQTCGWITFPNLKLGTIADTLGIEVDKEKQHGADYDVDLTRLVYGGLRELIAGSGQPSA